MWLSLDAQYHLQKPIYLHHRVQEWKHVAWHRLHAESFLHGAYSDVVIKRKKENGIKMVILRLPLVN